MGFLIFLPSVNFEFIDNHVEEGGFEAAGADGVEDGIGGLGDVVEVSAQLGTESHASVVKYQRLQEAQNLIGIWFPVLLFVTFSNSDRA